ncbi:hypothetical protein DPMN_149286 [Dreissena polymorpha]|uniref:Secreted protein n=1 Tax=Dreissena polymorpha TaxID=45954 RepID=A0A9D4J559_DREPO|nr:hypothetical protein DPMN_149286 [Dreissena polymorpha]
MILSVCIIYWNVVAVVLTERDIGQPPQCHGAAFHIGVDEVPAFYKGTTFGTDANKVSTRHHSVGP